MFHQDIFLDLPRQHRVLALHDTSPPLAGQGGTRSSSLAWWYTSLSSLSSCCSEVVGDHLLKGTYVIAIAFVPPILNLSSIPAINKLILSSLGWDTAFTVDQSISLLHTSTTVPRSCMWSLTLSRLVSGDTPGIVLLLPAVYYLRRHHHQ